MNYDVTKKLLFSRLKIIHFNFVHDFKFILNYDKMKNCGLNIIQDIIKIIVND